MILSADTTSIQSTVLTLLSYSKPNECDSGGDEIQSNNKSMGLSLILQKPWSDRTNIVTHDSLERLLIGSAELTQTSKASHVCSGLSHTNTLPHFVSSNRQISVQIYEEFLITVTYCLFTDTQGLSIVSPVFSVFSIFVSSLICTLHKHLFGHMLRV